LVGRDDELARALDADGLHLPERDLQNAPALRRLYPQWILTGAVHTANSWDEAKALDAAVVSPVFPAGGTSASKTALGIEGFNILSEAAPCPVYGLGGIHAGNADALLQTRACGLAGVDAIKTAFTG